MTEIQKLRKAIELHNELYQKGKPLISDSQYDELVRQHAEITGQNVEGGAVSPPVVGSPVGYGSPKVAHPAVMLSLNNAFDQQQRSEAWHSIVRRVPDAQGYADLKIDGMAVRLDYQNGELAGAATRGDGSIGENIFENAVRMLDVPKVLELDVPGRISIVGEAYMRNSDFTLLNNELEQTGEELYASPRNVVAGGMRHSNPDEVRRRSIRFLAYGLLHESSPRGFTRHSEIMEWLIELGFSIVPRYMVPVSRESEVENAFETLSKFASDYDYDCDGIVIKLDGLPGREILGAGRTAPNWAFACKFPAKAERTVLESVSFSVGRTGAVTPVGHVKPVLIGDVTVSNVTLHNKDIIEGLDLRVGDHILLKRAGDVIPAVEQVFAEERKGGEQPIEFPSTCPECSTVLYRPANEARIYCPNSLLCKGQLQRGMEHFVEQDYMALNGVGPAAISTLISRGLVNRVSDLYGLTFDDLADLPGFGDTKAENMLNEITASKYRPVHRLMASLGIHEVGRSASEVLMAHFGSLRALLDATREDNRQAAYLEIRALEGFGPKMTESLLAYMGNANNREQLEIFVALGVGADIETGVEPEVENGSGEAAGAAAPQADQPLADMNVCATGKLESYTRSTINSTIKAMGGKPQSSVTKATDLLIVGEKAGSKLAKARSLGVRVVNQWEFEDMIS